MNGHDVSSRNVAHTSRPLVWNRLCRSTGSFACNLHYGPPRFNWPQYFGAYWRQPSGYFVAKYDYLLKTKKLIDNIHTYFHKCEVVVTQESLTKEGSPRMYTLDWEIVCYEQHMFLECVRHRSTSEVFVVYDNTGIMLYVWLKWPQLMGYH